MKLANLAKLRFTQFAQVSFVHWTDSVTTLFCFVLECSIMIQLTLTRKYSSFIQTSELRSIERSQLTISNSFGARHKVVIVQRENGDHKHILQHIFREVQSVSVTQYSELTLSVQIERNFNSIRQKKLIMSRQDSLNQVIVRYGTSFLLSLWMLLSCDYFQFLRIE